jgi:excisionase family DNA binding protein
MDADKLYSVDDAATFLGGVSSWTIHAWIGSGKLLRTKVGRRTMVRHSELEAFIGRCNPQASELAKTAGSR